MSNREPREVILGIGAVGSGKSRAALSVAHLRPDKVLHYIVADRAIDKLYEHFPEIQDRNVIEYDGYSYSAVERAIKQIRDIAAGNPREHWIVLDTVGQIYRMKQDLVAVKYYGAPMGEFKADPKSIGGLLQFQWNEVKAGFYNEIAYPVLRYSNCNVFLIAHTVPIENKWYTRPEMPVAADRFHAIGMVPDVHRDLARYVDTVIHFGSDHEHNTWWIETVKDTGVREYITRTDIKNEGFWAAYLRLSQNGTVALS